MIKTNLPVLGSRGLPAGLSIDFLKATVREGRSPVTNHWIKFKRNNMKISLFGNDSESFKTALEEAGLKYEIRRLQPGVIMASGEDIALVTAVAAMPIWPQLAQVIIVWLNAGKEIKKAREMRLTTRDNKIVTLVTKGYSADDVVKILQEAKSAIVIGRNDDSAK